jgi:hypothetical protein
VPVTVMRVWPAATLSCRSMFEVESPSRVISASFASAKPCLTAVTSYLPATGRPGTE